MLFALAVAASGRRAISYQVSLAFLRHWIKLNIKSIWQDGQVGEGVKMQHSDWPKAFHFTYMLIVVAQRQKHLHRLNLHGNWNRWSARCNKMRPRRAATSVIKGQNAYRVWKIRTSWQVWTWRESEGCLKVCLQNQNFIGALKFSNILTEMIHQVNDFSLIILKWI